MFPIWITKHCGNLSKVVGATLFNIYYQFCGNLSKVQQTFQLPILLKRWDGDFECDFSIKYGG